jgi:hypothetical protein
LLVVHFAFAFQHNEFIFSGEKGIVDFINQEVPDAKIDPTTTEIFERVKDGILI